MQEKVLRRVTIAIRAISILKTILTHFICLNFVRGAVFVFFTITIQRFIKFIYRSNIIRLIAINQRRYIFVTTRSSFGSWFSFLLISFSTHHQLFSCIKSIFFRCNSGGCCGLWNRMAVDNVRGHFSDSRSNWCWNFFIYLSKQLIQIIFNNFFVVWKKSMCC